MQSLVTAGLASGTVEGAIIAPFERVKVYIQVQRQRMSEVRDHPLGPGMFEFCIYCEL